MGMDSLLTVGLTLKFFDQMSKGLVGSINTCIGSLDKMQAKLKTISQEFGQLGRASLGTGLIMAATLKKPLDAFTELEDAQTSLKSTLMEKGGIVPAIFKDIDKVAMKLGNELPGTTADFYNLASGMNALKVSGESLAHGSLEAAAKLGVALKDQGVSYQETGEFAAKFKQAMGISDKDMVASMDTIQRLGHMGVKIEEMRYAFADLTGTLQPLGIQGLAAANKIAPLVGMLVGMGKSGRMVGNAIGDMIKAGFDVKKLGEANEALGGTGIKLKFVDTKGKFMGFDNMLNQMDKLRNLSDAKRMAVAKALFGGLTGEQADVFNIIVSKGRKGYEEYVSAMENQASLNERVAVKLKTLTNVWEAFTGTFKNALAEIAGSAAPTLKRLSEIFNDLSEKIRIFAEHHKVLTSVISHGALAFTAALVIFGGLSIAAGLLTGGLARLTGGFNLAITGVKGFTRFVIASIPWIRLQAAEIWRMAGAQKMLAAIEYRGGFWKAMQYGAMTTRFRILQAGGLFPWLGRAIMALWPALTSNPVGWVALAIIGAAILIIKFWKPIKAFFIGVWQGIKEAFAPLAEIFKPFLVTIKPVIDAMKNILKPMEVGEGKLKAIANIGRIVGKVLALAFLAPVYLVNWAGNAMSGLLKAIKAFPETFKNLGANLMKALGAGIRENILAPINAIKGVGASVIGSFKKILGIASPSAIFTSFGFQIAQGAALGMNKGLQNVSTAAKRMTQPIFQPMSMPMPAAAGAGGGGGGMPIQVVQHLNFGANVDRAAAGEMASQVGTATEAAMDRAIDKYFARKGRKEW